MSRKVRYILIAVLTVSLAVGMSFVLDLVHASRAEILCRKIDVTLLDDFMFFDSTQVCALVRKSYGPCLDEPLDSIRLSEIESLLESRGVIQKSEVWTTDDGVLHIDIRQRRPEIRCDRGGRHLYIDRTGYVFSSEKLCTANCQVIEGNIPRIEEEGEEAWVGGVLSLTDFMRSSKKLRDSLDKVIVDNKGDLVLTMKGHSERFIFGSPSGFEDKFEKMDRYFSHIAPSCGNGFYKSVNLKYNKQLICRKDI